MNALFSADHIDDYELYPYEHAEYIHREARRGQVFIANLDRNGKWHQYSIPAGEIAKHTYSVKGHRDTYISYNRFWGTRRLVESVLAINAVFVDLDPYALPASNALKKAAPQEVFQAAAGALDAAGIMHPSRVVFTGRGLALVWDIDPIPAAALKRWNAVQRHLNQTLASCGADQVAVDAARMTRIVGTVNSKSGEVVRIIDGGTGSLVDFDVLADQVLPLTRVELRELQAKRATEKAAKKPQPAKKTRTRYNQATLHQTILSDIEKLMKGRFGDGPLPDGHRDMYVFFGSCSLAWLLPGGEPLKRKVIALGERVGWPPKETLNRMSAVLSRARTAAQGGVDQRYRHQVSTIVAKLNITDDEMRTFYLRCLVTDEVAREHDAARKMKERREAGNVPRDDYLANCQATRQSVLDMGAAGMTIPMIARALGKSVGAVRKLISRVNTGGLVAQTIAANENGPTANAKVDKSVPVFGSEARSPGLSSPALEEGDRQIGESSGTKGANTFLESPCSTQPTTKTPLAQVKWYGGVISEPLRRWIRSAMLQSGITQAELAKHVGISPGHVSNVLTGRSGAGADVAERIISWADSVDAA